MSCLPKRCYATPAAAAFLMSILCGLSGCGGPPDIIVSIGQWPEDAERLRVRTLLNGVAGQEQFIDKGMTRFVVRLPESASGAVGLDLAALDGGDCKVAAGALARDVATGLRSFSEDSVDLAALMPHRCTLTVRVAHGKGGVTSTPAGIDCKDGGGICELDLPVGSAVTLSTMPGARHFGGLLSKPCPDNGPCAFQLSRSSQVAVSFSSRSCSADGWCWQNPLPTGNAITASWAQSGQDLWAAGQAGTILHWDGASWNGFTAITSNHLNGIWGSSSTDIWAVGQAGTILHWDGKQWSSANVAGISQSLNAIWGSSATDVWIAGADGLLLHYDGERWLTRDSGTHNTLLAVRGMASADIWAVGEMGTALHYDGMIWKAGTIGSGKQRLRAIGGVSAGDVWVVGQDGLIFHWTSGSWNQVSSGVTAQLNAVWAIGPSDIWASGDAGVLVHYNGGGWNSFASGTSNPLLTLTGSSSGDVWSLGAIGTIIHWNGITWQVSSGATNDTIYSIWGSGAQDIWAASSVALLRWRGSRWEQMGSEGPAGGSTIWGSSATDVWVGGGSAVSQWDGSKWTSYADGNSYFSQLWGSGPMDLWGVGQRCEKGTCAAAAFHLQGKNWNSTSLPSSLRELTSVSGTSASDVWAGGWFFNGSYSPALLQWNGSIWSKVDAPPGTSEDIHGVWVGNPGKPWFASNDGILRPSGSGWETLRAPGMTSLYAIWGSSDQDVWAVGHAGIMVHWDGQSLKPVSSGVGKPDLELRGVWGAGQKDVWVVGDSGTILRYEPM